jgi:superfamily II DNA or RNA helicase
MKQLRNYQIKAVESFKEWTDSEDPLATIILPTGTGKTYVMSSCFEWLYSQQKNKPKLLWAAHRKELIDQGYEELKKIPNVNVEIEMKDSRATLNADIVVGTVQTLHRDRKNLKGWAPDYIVIDEWHHFHEDNTQYQGLRDRFPNAKVLGATATPFRFTGGDLPLGRKLVEMDIGTAVRSGYLVPPIPDTIKTNVSLAGVKRRAGDFAINELSVAVNTDERNKLIAKRILRAVKEEKRQGILFGVDVAHAHAMYELLKNEVRAVEIFGTTPDEERIDIINRIKAGEVDVVCNNLVLLEGFDATSLSFICMARPTSSLGLYTQAVGRGLRLHEGKKDCLVIDVWDKVKVTQSRITYSDLARAGDIDGSNKRISSILKEPIADELKNFPVIMRLEDNERLQIDAETWFAPAWSLADNQWVITWTKSEERIKTDKFDYVPLSFAPNPWAIKKSPMSVKHRFFGVGSVMDSDTNSGKVLVSFIDGMKELPYSELSKQEIKYEKNKLTVPIRRVLYLCLHENNGRLISLLQQKNKYKVIDDIRGDKTTLDEFVRATAEQDDIVQIVKNDAKWRLRNISDKQKNLIESFISRNKIGDDIDLNSITAGDASNIIDQVSWHNAINILFSAEKQEELIGHNKLMEYT